MTLVIRGTLIRPEGSDGFPPAVGTKVAYARAQPIVDLVEQADFYGFPFLGVEGNLEHLQKHGGHTPWRAYSKRGIIWAFDTDPGDEFESWFIFKCASNYETRWVRFWNFRGHQYDNAGNFQSYSDDHHLHIEVEDGHELNSVTLFDDYMTTKDGPMFTIEQLLSTIIPSSNGNIDVRQRLKDATSAKITADKALIAAQDAALSAADCNNRAISIEAKLNDIIVAPPTPIDYPKLAKAMVDEFYSRNIPPVV